MKKFTQGQWVVRRNCDFLDAKVGGRYRVRGYLGTQQLLLSNLLGDYLAGSYEPENFELDTSVEQPEDTTPAPAKMYLSEDPQERKDTPITSGVLDYFPLAIAAVAQCSKVGNDQHNPGQPLHWAKGKSTDHADCIARHLIDRHTNDTDGVRHVTKLAWRALALLQTVLEAERANKA